MFDSAIGVYLVKMFLLLIGQGSRILLSIGWRNANSTLGYLIFTNPTLLNKTQAAS